MDSLVFNTTDHFKDADDKDSLSKKDVDYVHIRIQQRNGRKSLTTVSGMAEDLDFKKILKALKKNFSTNGTILTDEEGHPVIQLQGDQRQNVFDFLTKFGICQKTEVKIHGF